MNQVTTMSPREVSEQLNAMQSQFAAALPAHIPVDRFVRVAMTAINNNPDLAKADRKSLWNACVRAAQDGLLPDGKEGALVIYNTKIKDKETGRDNWVSAVQWMPMVSGILKKARNSGEIASILARVVYEGDTFRNWIDDEGEHIQYEASPTQNREVVRFVFAMAKLKTGEIKVETLTPADVEKIREVSKSKDRGPWVSWWEEMAKKSAIRRLAKTLPMSTDLDDIIRRDDELYEFKNKEATTARIGSINDRLTALAAPVLEAAATAAPKPENPAASSPARVDLSGGVAAPPDVTHDPETGEVMQDDAPDPRETVLEVLRQAAARGGEKSLRMKLDSMSDKDKALVREDDVQDILAEKV